MAIRVVRAYPWADSIGHDRDVEIRHLAECLGESQCENSALSNVKTGLPACCL